MLSINRKMLPRLDELEADLLGRRQRAIDEGWRGEVEGIDLTLRFVASKRAQAHRAPLPQAVWTWACPHGLGPTGNRSRWVQGCVRASSCAAMSGWAVVR